MTDFDFAAWLRSPDAMRLILVDAMVSIAGVETPLYLSNAVYVTGATETPADTAYQAIINGGVQITERLAVAANGKLASSLNTADIQVENSNGERDAWLNDSYVWDNRPLVAYIGDARWPKSDFRVIFSGVVASLGSASRTALNLVMTDKFQRLNAASTDMRLGGTTSNKDVLLPILLGECHNVTPLLTNPATLEYQVHNGSIRGIIEVRDNGVPVAFTPDLANGKFRLDASPAGTITASIQGSGAAQALGIPMREYTFPISPTGTSTTFNASWKGAQGFAYVETTGKFWTGAVYIDDFYQGSYGLGDVEKSRYHLQIVDAATGYAEQLIERPNYTHISDASFNVITYPIPQIGNCTKSLIYDTFSNTVWLVTPPLGLDQARNIWRYHAATGALLNTYAPPQGQVGDIDLRLNRFNGDLWAILCGYNTHGTVDRQHHLGQINKTTGALSSNFTLVVNGINLSTTVSGGVQQIAFTSDNRLFVVISPVYYYSQSTGFTQPPLNSRPERFLFEVNQATGATTAMCNLNTLGVGEEYFTELLYDDTRNAIVLFSVDQSSRVERIFRYSLASASLDLVGVLPTQSNAGLYIAKANADQNALGVPAFTYDRFRDLIWFLPFQFAGLANESIIAISPTTAQIVHALEINSQVIPYDSATNTGLSYYFDTRSWITPTADGVYAQAGAYCASPAINSNAILKITGV